MGLCLSKSLRDQKAQNAKIEQEIRMAELKRSRLVKLLLLGAGECGKSTIVKQMTIIHDNGFDEEEIQQKKAIIYSNTLSSMAAILHAMEDFGIPLEDPENEEEIEVIYRVMELKDDLLPWTEDVYNALKLLWADKGVQESFERKSEYNLNDSAIYFMQALDRIHAPGYKPTDQDILHVRVATTGVTEIEFMIKSRRFTVYDVGGQRSERRKWISSFDHVDAVIFMIAISEYDQTLYEDEKTNRMVEAMKLFGTICNGAWFIKTSMVLFMNKKDLFDEKIKKGVSINRVFPDYNGPITYEDCINYMREKFVSLNVNQQRKKIYTHETCATDTNQVKLVIAAVVDIVIDENIKRMGFS